MKENISHDQLLLLLNYDPVTGLFTQRMDWWNRKAGDVPGGKTPQGYWYIGVGGKQYPAHRLAWFYVHKEWPAGDIDHINRNRMDNRIENLRHMSTSQNLHNATVRKTNVSGTVGVTFDARSKKRPWCARIRINYKMHNLGSFATLDEAIAARKKAEFELL